ncbi:YwbE family protein [Clostridium guangxiense]|uniref:YwbE family protein n=1 Tax=Clostridium guangxiense TaxID=1662055 RepID=UPI001E4B7F65|nr:YwbE family protein [Clostridium guangxiense]MCD2348536.1 YwbE family protein [Clostridium guangxiense]
MDGTIRKDIKVGIKVLVVQKQDQRSGKLTEGVVQRILTNSEVHPRGIKVMLEGGIVGRVKEIK